MTPRAFWDRHGGLWEGVPGTLRLVWVDDLPGTVEGWLENAVWLPREPIEQYLGPLIPTA